MPKSVLYDEAEVIHRTTQLFWKKGYYATSMQDIVDCTGLNRSSLYNSFGDKFGLFKACLVHYKVVQNEFTRGLLKDQQSAKESLISLFKGIESDIKSSTSKGCFISNCIPELGAVDGEVRDFLIENKDSMLAVFEQLICQAQIEKDIAPDKNAKHLAIFLFSSLQGIRLTGIIETDKEAITAIREQILKNI